MSIPITTGIVARLYQAAFDRVPEQEGVTFWEQQLAAGRPLDDIAAFFVASPEFVSLYGSSPMTSAAFVDAIYVNVLGRPAEPGGREFWIGQLDAGMSRGRMLSLVSDSPENRDNASPFFIASGDVFGGPPGSLQQVAELPLGSLGAYELRVGGANGGTATLGNNAVFETGDYFKIGGTGGGSLVLFGARTRFEARDGNVATQAGERASIAILEGAHFTVTGEAGTESGMIVGRRGGDAAILVDGPGSRLAIERSDGFFTLGRDDAASEATLTVQNAGSFVSAPTVNIGREGASGQLFVTGPGSRVEAAGNLIAGRDGGNGSVRVEAGASVSAGDVLGIGRDGGRGELIAAGTGTTIKDARFLEIGADGGSGTASIREGAVAAAFDFSVGLRDGAVGTATIEGTGSSVAASNWINIGHAAIGTLTVAAGATLSGVGMSVGRDPAGDGTVIVTGPGAQATFQGVEASGNNPFLVVGGAGGTGRVEIRDGGALTLIGAADQPFVGFTLARDEGTSGTLVISGQGSQLTISSAATGDFGAGGLFNIGRVGEGILTVEGGGRLVNDPDGWTFLGARGGNATVVLDGEGTLFDAGVRLVVGGGVDFASGNADFSTGGSATVAVRNGAILEAGIAGDGIADIVVGPGSTLNAASGGIIRADVVTEGGSFVPGNSPGTLAIEGDLTATGGLFEFELGDGNGPRDQIVVAGSLAIGDVVLRILLEDGFAAAAGAVFDLFIAEGGVSLTGTPIIEVNGVADGAFGVEVVGNAVRLVAEEIIVV